MTSAACPWCLEPLPGRLPADGLCPRCGRPVRTEQGLEVRPIDVRYERVTASQARRFRRLAGAGAAVAAGMGLVAPLLHAGLTPVLVVPLLLAAHLVALRLFLIRESWRMLAPRRRFVARWLIRLAFLWVGVPGYGLTLVPGLGVVASPATFLALTALVHFYASWSLRRERERLPLALWEKLLLVGLVVLTVLVLAVLIGLALVLGWTVKAIWSAVHSAHL